MSITLTLILVIFTSLISYQAFENYTMRQKLIMHPASVKQRGEFYRFLTSGFIHANWMHLIINMYVLFTFGEAVEKALNYYFGGGMGRILFTVLYLGAIIISSVPSYIKHQNNEYYSALGASGGTSAIVFAFIFFDPWQWFLFPPLPGVLLAVAYLMYSSYMSKKGGDNIGHDAHLWGAVYGLVFMIVICIIWHPELLNAAIQLFLEGPSAPNFI